MSEPEPVRDEYDRRFELLVSSVTDYAIYMLDPDGRIATWNAGARRYKGYEAEEVIGEHFSRFFTEEDRKADLPARALRISAREGRYESEGWRVRKDGTRFWASVVLDPIRDEGGRLVGFAKITRDITQKKEAEEALRQSERRFQLLVNSVTDYAIYMLDPLGHVATWNAGARRFKGYEADEIIGEHFSRFFTPEERRAGRPAAILRTAAKEGRFEAEGVRQRKDGTRFVAHVVVDAIRDEKGELLGFAKITRDITEKREQQKALRESEQRFKMLVEGVRDYAIYMLDTEGRISNWNSGAQAIKGYSAEEIVGQHFSRFYTEEDRTNGEPQRALETALREGKYEREAQRVRKDGSLFWASVVIDPIYDEIGKHVGFAKITRDVTERRQAQDEVEEARAALAQSQKLQALGELTGGIAHDFNNLMTVIAGSTELLLKRPDMPEEKRRRYLEAIAETTKRATTLTSHLLAFGRRQPIRPEVLDINVRLDALGEVLSRTLGSRIEVVLQLSPALPPIEVDPAELETALLNAAFNARDAMPDGGRLTFATGAGDDGKLVWIEVRDTGTGMSAEVVERAFEPFFTTKEVGKGTGLGLSQIHGFAAQAGGNAEIQSRPTEGTAVRIHLPASDKPLTVSVAERTWASIPEGLRVLVVEDNDQVREFARALLVELRCEVLTAVDAQEALSLLEEQEVDLLFSDIVMPRMSGLELAATVRELYPELPILLASGYSEEISRSGSGEFEVLGKPYGSEGLSAAIACRLAAARQRAA
ncbi:MAG TPA: PAS domain S-box protein [Allosphingosinicella sp.]|jgi:PAS domain S-box-containing protein